MVFPTPDGPSKQTISPFSLIVKETLLTLFFSLAIKVALLISRKFVLILILIYLYCSESIYLEIKRINILAQIIKHNEGKAAASNKSCAA